jgi:hypothetical protein
VEHVGGDLVIGLCACSSKEDSSGGRHFEKVCSMIVASVKQRSYFNVHMSQASMPLLLSLSLVLLIMRVNSCSIK